jgi:hypothetical protein
MNLQNKENQTRILQMYYNSIGCYPKKKDIQKISEELNMDKKKLRSWFNRERHRKKLENNFFDNKLIGHFYKIMDKTTKGNQINALKSLLKNKIT